MIALKPFKALLWAKALILVAVFFCCCFASAQEKQADSKPARFMSRLMKNITPEQGKKYLGQIGIDTVSRIPETNMLLVTAEPGELIRATVVLKMVDVIPPFVIGEVSAVSEINELTVKEIQADINDLSIGTFADPPSGDAKYKAIIDGQGE